MLSLEAKVGAFVLTGLVCIATAIFLLGDYTFERRYTVYATFTDVANLSKDAPVKLAGVEIGKVKGLILEDHHAKVVMAIRSGVDIYNDSEFEIGSTGIIGSKYLAINQGHPSAGVLPAGSVVRGVDPVSIEKSLNTALGKLDKLLASLTEEGPRGSLTDNLRETVANVRDMTANLNDLIETTKPKLEKSLERTDDITKKLDELLGKSNQMMAGLSTDKGAVGALLHDEKVKEDVKQTIADVKEAASTAKDVFGRITQFRVYWNYDWRYDSLARTSHSDIGLKIYPREGRYYYGGVANIANLNDAPRGHQPDYTQPNRVDGLLGWELGPLDVAVGAIRSAGGARATVTPLYKDPFWGRFSVTAQAYDFGRNRVVNGKVFDKPAYDAGLLAKINDYVGLGARVEDIALVKRVMAWANVHFEDRDIAYMFGMATFGAAGTKGRSKK
ncbi:MAG: MCE family protein [Elusimicrobia bacterium]|nr:MCE family protein [Elusimicrobiota bacterium]